MFNITPVHLHLLVNHLPVEGSLVSVILVIYAMARNNAELKRTALIACVVTGIAAFVADSTGGGAARVARTIAGVDKLDIKAHIAAADLARNASYVLAVVALVGLILAWRKNDSPDTAAQPITYTRRHKEPHLAIMIATLVIGLAVAGLMANAAYHGGMIRHPEIEPNYNNPAKPDTTIPAASSLPMLSRHAHG